MPRLALGTTRPPIQQIAAFSVRGNVVLGKLFYAVVLEPTDCRFSCFCRGLFGDSGFHECDAFVIR